MAACRVRARPHPWGPHRLVVWTASPPQWPATWTWPSTPWTSRSACCTWRAVSAAQAAPASPGAPVREGRGSGRQGPVQLAWLRASTERGAGRPEQPGLHPMGQCPAYLGLGAQITHLSASWGRGGSPLGHLAMAACMLASSSGPVRPAEVPGVAPGATMASAPARAGRPRRAAGGGGRGAVLPSGLSRRRLLVRGHRLLLV